MIEPSHLDKENFQRERELTELNLGKSGIQFITLSVTVPVPAIYVSNSPIPFIENRFGIRTKFPCGRS